MQDRELEQLLRRGETDYVFPSLPADNLVMRVHARQRRWRHVRLASIAATAICVLVAGGTLRLRVADRPTAESTLTRIEIAAPSLAVRSVELKHELERIESEIRVAESTVAIVLRDRELAGKLDLADQLDLQDQVRIDIDVVADGMLRRADESIGDMVVDDTGIAAYKRVIEFFPHSHPAQIARKRLDELRN